MKLEDMLEKFRSQTVASIESVCIYVQLVDPLILVRKLLS